VVTTLPEPHELAEAGLPIIHHNTPIITNQEQYDQHPQGIPYFSKDSTVHIKGHHGPVDQPSDITPTDVGT